MPCARVSVCIWPSTQDPLLSRLKLGFGQNAGVAKLADALEGLDRRHKRGCCWISHALRRTGSIAARVVTVIADDDARALALLWTYQSQDQEVDFAFLVPRAPYRRNTVS